MTRIRFTTRTIATIAYTLLLGVTGRAAPGPWYDERIQLQLAPGIEIDEVAADYQSETLDSLEQLHLLQPPEGIPQQQILQAMSGDPRIEWAEPAYWDQTPEGTRQMLVIIVGGTVTEYQDQHVLERIRLDEILPHTTGSGVVVAVLDTGVEEDHPALAGSILKDGFDFVDNDTDAADTANGLDDDDDGNIDEGAGHGTMVAGIVHLIAPDALILPVRVLDDEGRGDSFDVAKGIYYAVEHGAQVINMSLGLPVHCNTIAWGVNYAAQAGVTLVSAAGNDGSEGIYYPASDAAVLSVAALDSTDVKSAFSNYHPEMTISAPGDGILAPFYDGQYAIGAGTSFAAPFIAGQAALVWSGGDVLGHSDVKVRMLAGVVSIDDLPGNAPFVGKLGTGRFDGLATWLAISQTTDVPSPAGPARSWSVFPNPSASVQSVTIASRDLVSAPTFASVHDVDGRLVARLHGSEGVLQWNGRDQQGRVAPAGIYRIRIQTEGMSAAIPVLRLP